LHARFAVFCDLLRGFYLAVSNRRLIRTNDACRFLENPRYGPSEHQAGPREVLLLHIIESEDEISPINTRYNGEVKNVELFSSIFAEELSQRMTMHSARAAEQTRSRAGQATATVRWRCRITHEFENVRNG
jgi:hypothetical protein